MISRDELVNRQYLNKEIIAFDYFSEPDEDGEFYKVSFQRVTPTHWQAVLTNFFGFEDALCRCSGTTVYAFDFDMPKPNMPLDYVAEVGLTGLERAFNETYARSSVWASRLYRKLN